MSDYKNKHLNFSKEFLLKKYITKSRNAYEIAQELNCSSTIIYYYLKKHNIKRRTLSQASKGISKNVGKNNPMFGKHCNSNHYKSCSGENAFNYNEERHKEHHCIGLNCNIEICYDTYFRGRGMCSSCAKKTDWNDKDYIRKQMAARSVIINKTEQLLESLLTKLLPNIYKFVGSGEIILDKFCPDFININGQKKIIELFGDYWHRDTQQRDKVRIETYKKHGYKTLIIWEYELKNRKNLESKILNFNRR